MLVGYLEFLIVLFEGLGPEQLHNRVKFFMNQDAKDPGTICRSYGAGAKDFFGTDFTDHAVFLDRIDFAGIGDVAMKLHYSTSDVKG